MSAETERLARAVLNACEAQNILLATAESCTGGMIAAALTDIAGSSAVVERGFVTYSNDAKQDMLGVKTSTLERHGAVSEQTALEMAAGALAHSRAGTAISVTGIAGPGGGSDDKPVGLVWFGLARAERAAHAEYRIFANADRAGVRQAATEHALATVLHSLENG